MTVGELPSGVAPGMVRRASAGLGLAVQTIALHLAPWVVYLAGIRSAHHAWWVTTMMLTVGGMIAVIPLRRWAGVPWKLRTAALCWVGPALYATGRWIGQRITDTYTGVDLGWEFDFAGSLGTGTIAAIAAVIGGLVVIVVTRDFAKAR